MLVTSAPLQISALLACCVAFAHPQDSRRGPTDLPSLAATVADSGDLVVRRAALQAISRIFDDAADAAAAFGTDNARKSAARLRARALLATEYGAAMRASLERGVESKLLDQWSTERRRSILDALGDLRVDATKVVAALEGALRDDSSVSEVISEMAAYDHDGSAATVVLLRLATGREHHRRQAAQWALYDMGSRARGAQEGLVMAFLAAGPASRPESGVEPGSRLAATLRDSLELLQPLYVMGPAPAPLVRRVISSLESDYDGHRYLVGLLGTLDPKGAVARRFARDRFFGAGEVQFGILLARWESDPAPIVAELLRKLEVAQTGSIEATVETLGNLGSAARSATPALVRLYEARPATVLPSTDLLRTELRRKIREALLLIEADPDELFRVLSPALATEEDSWQLEKLCEHFDGLNLSLPRPEALAATLREHGSDLEAHRAAFLIGRHGPAGAAAVSALGAALNRGSSSLRWVSARSLTKIGPGGAAAIPDIVVALCDEARTAESQPVEKRRPPWTTRQWELCAQLSDALGAIGPAAKEARPVLMATLATVHGVEPDQAYAIAHEDFDRIVPPSRPTVAIVEDPSLVISQSARWMPSNRGPESRPFHVSVSADPDGQFRVVLFDIRKWREFWVTSWTRTVFLRLDPARKLVVTSELWCNHGGGRPHCTKEAPDLAAIRLRPVDLALGERIEFAYDSGEDWIEVTIPNPFKK